MAAAGVSQARHSGRGGAFGGQLFLDVKMPGALPVILSASCCWRPRRRVVARPPAPRARC